MRRSWWLALAIGCGGGGGTGGSDAPHDTRAGDAPAAGMATGTLHVLNGASPAGPAFRVSHLAADGNWQVSPDGLRVPITGIALAGMGNPSTTVALASCTVTFDLHQPGLAPALACPFTIPAGTYVAADPVWAATFDILIDDAADGIYTDPTSATQLSATPLAGGAPYVTVPNPRFGTHGGTAFAQPLVVADGDQVTVSILIDALQSLIVDVRGSTRTFGADGNGQPGFPDVVTAVGTPAAIAYYVNADLGTAHSYLPGPGTHPLAISVLYASPTTPAFLGITTGTLPGCGPLQLGFLFAGKGHGYLGLDASGVLGWADFSDAAATMYSAVMRMPQASALGATTTFACLDTTTDPMPPGDSFASGAPAIPTPTRTDAMTLVAR